MEAPNFEDSFLPTKGRLTIGGQTDPTGSFLEELLAHVGLEPHDVVCTNAVLCLPRYDGRRYRVTRVLRESCRPWLEQLIAVLNPRVVVTFGAQPLRAVGRIERHGLSLKLGSGRLHDWNGRRLLPLYHPGSLGRITRSAEQQKRDIEAILGALSTDGASAP